MRHVGALVVYGRTVHLAITQWVKTALHRCMTEEDTHDSSLDNTKAGKEADSPPPFYSLFSTYTSFLYCGIPQPSPTQKGGKGHNKLFSRRYIILPEMYSKHDFLYLLPFPLCSGSPCKWGNPTWFNLTPVPMPCPAFFLKHLRSDQGMDSVGEELGKTLSSHI